MEDIRNMKKSKLSVVIDGIGLIFISFILFALCFGKIIGFCVSVITLMLYIKVMIHRGKKDRLLRKKDIERKIIQSKLLLAFDKDITLIGYQHLYGNVYMKDKAKYILIRDNIGEKDIRMVVQNHIKGIIAVKKCDENILDMAKKLGLEIICDVEDLFDFGNLETEIEKEMSIKKKRENVAFVSYKAKKYLGIGVLFFVLSRFMGRYGFMYLVFAFFAIVFSFICKTKSTV